MKTFFFFLSERRIKITQMKSFLKYLTKKEKAHSIYIHLFIYMKQKFYRMKCESQKNGVFFIKVVDIIQLRG